MAFQLNLCYYRAKGHSGECPHSAPQYLLFVGLLDQDEQHQLLQLDLEHPWVGTMGYFTCREGAASRRALMAVQSNKGYVHVCVQREQNMPALPTCPS